MLKRIDGCMYAVKLSMKQLHQETERYCSNILQKYKSSRTWVKATFMCSLFIIQYFCRRKALMEVQALAALGLLQKCFLNTRCKAEILLDMIHVFFFRVP